MVDYSLHCLAWRIYMDIKNITSNNNMKNKKAFAPILAAGGGFIILAVALIIIIGAIAFLASSAIRYTLIGVAIIGMTFIYVIPSAISGEFNKNKIFFVLILMVIGVFFIVLPKTNLIQQTAIPTSCSGGQVLSISSAIKTYSSGLQKDVIRVEFSTLPQAECIDIKWNEVDLENKLKQTGVDFDVQKSSLGDIILYNYKKIYNIRQQTTGTYEKIGFTNIAPGGIFEGCSNDHCRDKIPTGAILIDSIQNNPTLGRCNCVHKYNYGYPAEFQSSEEYVWDTKIKIDGEGETTLFSHGVNDVKLTDNIGNNVFVAWSGNRVTNTNLGSIPRGAFLPINSQVYRMNSDSSSYTTERDRLTELKNDLTNRCNNLFSNCITETNNMAEYNTDLDLKTSSSNLQNWAAGESFVNAEATEIINNKLFVDLKTPTLYPTFTLDIVASEIGIFVTTGKPEVTCPANVNDLISGQTKFAEFGIKNIGQSNGAFQYTLICDKGSQVLSPAPPQSISTGNSLNVRATLGLTVPEQGSLSSNCVFTAKESNTLETDSCVFSYTSTYQGQCANGTKSCEVGNTELWTCNADGSFTKEECENSCATDGTTSFCKTSADGDGTDSDADQNETKVECIPFVESKVIKEGVDKGLFGWRSLLNSEKQFTTTSCVVSGAFIITIFGGVILIIVIMILSMKPKKGDQRKK